MVEKFRDLCTKQKSSNSNYEWKFQIIWTIIKRGYYDLSVENAQQCKISLF